MLTNWYMPNVLEPRDIEKTEKGGREVQEGGVASSLSCTAKTLQHYKAILQLKKKKDGQCNCLHEAYSLVLEERCCTRI